LVSAPKARASRHPPSGPAVPPGPERAGRAGRPLVVDTFLVRAANDAVHRRHGHDALGFYELQHLGRNLGIPADIGPIRHPAPQVERLCTLGRDDADRDLRGRRIIRAVERQGGNRVAPEPALRLLGQPLRRSVQHRSLR